MVDYDWKAASSPDNHRYLTSGVLTTLGSADGRSLLDLGCGNGVLTARLAEHGFAVVGLDGAESGVAAARQAFPTLDFRLHQVGDPLAGDLTNFDVVVATEVIEHLLLPRELFRRATEALAPGGLLLLSTPYHGYLKNLAIALTNGFDKHWTVGWDYGHVKFFSKRTLTAMAEECGFRVTSWRTIGRVPPFGASMVMTAVLREGDQP